MPETTVTIEIQNGLMRNQQIPISVEEGVSTTSTPMTEDSSLVFGAVTVLAFALANPAGGVVGPVLGLSVLVAKIIQLVRQANTMTVTLINAVPYSRLKIKDITIEEGRLTEPPRDVLLNDQATTQSDHAGAIQFFSEPYRSAGDQKGVLTAELTFEDGTNADFVFMWDNPLSRDSALSEASYPEPSVFSELIGVRKELDHPHVDGSGTVNRRADAVTLIVSPTQAGLAHIPSISRR